MRFSIIIPAHNTEKYIRKTLESIKMQEFTDYELIVVCDSCTDETEHIAREYTDKVYTVNYCKDGLTRNKGLAAATGEYILFMDSDDWWIHEFALTMIDSALKDREEDIDILAFGFIWMTRGYCGPISHSTPSRQYLYSNVWSKCWKRSFLYKNNISFRDIYPHSDMYFVSDAQKATDKIYSFDHALYYYNYLRDGSITKSLKE